MSTTVEIRKSDASSTSIVSHHTEVDLEKHASTKRTDTEVEQIAERIEKRRAERVRVTFKSRVRFLKGCRKIATRKGYDKPRISKQDVIEYRDRVQAEMESGKGVFNNPLLHSMGIKSDVQCLARILDKAVDLLESDAVDTGNWLYYRDFSFDYTRVVSRWPHMRHPLGVAGLVVFLYYLFTPILFCVIMPSSNICESDSGGYNGWVSAIYFASTTISTVGYGDLTVDQDPRYRSFIGSIYMLVSMVVAVVAFSAIASSSFSPMERFFENIFDRFNPKAEQDLFLHERIRKIRFVRITELAVEIFSFIVLGVLVSQLVVHYDGEPEEGTNWSWMTSLYWAVQTCTTIGYGDLDQPEGLRYFKIFYLMIATVLVGNALGKLGALKEELKEARRQHAWDRRPVTKRMIDEMQAYDHDDKIDQYEFLVSSLITLGKLSSEEIRPIMDKFRSQAGEKGYIAADDEIEEEDVHDEGAEAEMEEDVIDAEE